MGNLVSTRAVDIIRSECLSRGGREAGEDIKILCPFHDDNTPSALVHIGSQVAVGYLRCFSCGARAHWNEVAEKIGARKITDTDRNAINKIAPLSGTRFQGLKNNMLGQGTKDWGRFDKELIGKHPIPVATNWRGISKDILIDLGCWKTIDNKSDDTFLVIPVSVRDKVRMVVRARWFKYEGEQSYYSSAGVKKWGLLGYDHVLKMPAWEKFKTVILVEGPRDSLRLLSMGLPAVAILGATSFSEFKRDNLLKMKPRKIVTLFDNDDAGEEAAQRVKSTVGQHGPKVTIARFPHKDKCGKKIDPGNAPVRLLSQTWKKVRS